MKRLLLVLFSIGGLLVGCSGGGTGTGSSPSPSGSDFSHVTTPPVSEGLELPRPTARFAAGACQAQVVRAPLFVLPDRKCTPGITDPRVTQENLFEAPAQAKPGVGLCMQGYRTGWLRPNSNYTNAAKAEQMTEYGYSDQASKHEEDHLISLELGGNPTNIANLWPEPGSAPNPKDELETYLHNRVCYTRNMMLGQAQNLISLSWVSAYDQFVGAPDWKELKGRPLYHQ